MAVAALKDQPNQTGHRTPGVRLRELLKAKIDFIPHAEFELDGDSDRDETVEALLNATSEPTRTAAELPAHLRRLCDTELLTPAQERALFREMNYLKFRAAALREHLDSEQVAPEAIAEVESLLTKARSIRDHLIQANTRLVMSVVKKFVTPQQSFDEMLSDGIMILMQAVDKFDFDRGFRFSTYAYRSIARNAYRTVNTARQEEAMFLRDGEQRRTTEPPDYRSSSSTDQVWSNLRDLTASMLGRLDRRERFIIRCRYALGRHRKARTFQYLADKLGVSKERARQLEKRAVSKLQAMAAEYDLDDLFGTAMM